jgi:RimJ/RimL family protein N-acetyltransferase
MTYTLLRPFPKKAYGLLWNWILQFPDNSLDDYGPQTLQDFRRLMASRARTERTWAVESGGKLCGSVAYLPYNRRSGAFHGICFDRSIHGTGIAHAAVAAIIDEIFAGGVEKISAGYFADNQQVHKFLGGLGAVEEGLMRQHTLRGGTPLDMRLVAFFKGL